MCGRYALYGPISRNRALKDDAERFNWLGELVVQIQTRKPRYNIAPSQSAPVILVDDDGTSVRDLRWGLVPFWAKDLKIGYKAINARAETVAEKPMFRSAFKSQRCLVPASGYFEWAGTAPNKQPYLIHDPEGALLLFAGLWERWRPEKKTEAIYTFTIVTGPPGVVSGDIHDRAPVILSPEQWQPWLGGTVDDAKEVLEHFHEPELTYHPVSKAVGSPKNDCPELVEPVPA